MDAGTACIEFYTERAGYGQSSHGSHRGSRGLRRRVLYIAAYCHDSDPSGIVVNDIRKDFEPGEQDSFEVIIDTFGDRRNGYLFITNAEGAKSDQQVANEGRETNASWDAVWSVQTQRVDDGWTVEMAIPFKSLRFEAGRRGPGASISAGGSVARTRSMFWSPVAARVHPGARVGGWQPRGVPSTQRRAATCASSRSSLGDALAAVGGDAFDKRRRSGLDVKYGVTPALTLDLTVNPDFAQVEADEQQVNLTQFSQFFPEKREFFLENSGIFYVGDASATAAEPDTDARRRSCCCSSAGGSG